MVESRPSARAACLDLVFDDERKGLVDVASEGVVEGQQLIL